MGYLYICLNLYICDYYCYYIIFSCILLDMDSNKQYLQVAIRAAKTAAPIFKKYFGRPKTVSEKNSNPRDLVTEIDKRIELIIRQMILKTFPSHALIGEEYGWLGKNKKFKWFIDPIDGTGNYIQGLAFCCISIGLWDDKGPLVSVVLEPVNNLLYTAIRGRGAFLNGKQLTVSKTSKLIQTVGGIGWLKAKNGVKLFTRLIRQCKKIRVLASSTLQICLVAQGVLDFYTTHDIHIWDFAAAVLFISEAGGKSSEIKSFKISEKSLSIAVSNGKIHEELLKTIN